MQALRPSPNLKICSAEEYAEITAHFGGKLGLDDDASGNKIEEPPDEKQSSQDYCLRQEEKPEHEAEVEEKVAVEEEDDDYEFSFVCSNTDSSPISADDIFSDGQIKPIFPLFNQDLLFADRQVGDSNSKDTSAASLRPPLRKLFIEERDPAVTPSSTKTDNLDELPAGAFCVWSGKAVEASPEVCTKSNSTGFSKRWRFRDFVRRCNSDGKDAFVFLVDPSKEGTKQHEVHEKVEKTEVSKVKKNSGEVKAAAGKAKCKTTSAHEVHYVRNRASKEVDRRKSYLPYRKDLVGFGFFTNVNGMSRNLHPF